MKYRSHQNTQVDVFEKKIGTKIQLRREWLVKVNRGSRKSWLRRLYSASVNKFRYRPDKKLATRADEFWWIGEYVISDHHEKCEVNWKQGILADMQPHEAVERYSKPWIRRIDNWQWTSMKPHAFGQIGKFGLLRNIWLSYMLEGWFSLIDSTNISVEEGEGRWEVCSKHLTVDCDLCSYQLVDCTTTYPMKVRAMQHFVLPRE